MSGVNNPYMFTGRRYDSENYRTRYYNPYIGRFLQVDTIGYEDSMNLYIYVGNNPVILIDPWGLCGESVGIGEWLAADLYEFGHAVEGAVWAVEYGLTATVSWTLEPLSALSDVPDIPVPATQYNPQFIIPTSKIGVAAGAVDEVLGARLESHAEVAREQMQWHWSQEWQWGQMEWQW